ncbi:hypothetical protein GCM10011514_38120 [Emticicia aquatilis]|uniref:Uncharacterized protein n=1 Tax=Emticicia aquatilis TaxID=1537369 RepID=A0A917DTU6_9BACT|nr:hypothetical protein [Emticicia aquatilis]GGD70420.1 hypothetical protein GCM10011514_38120 [Emticicia aquatilis]
MKKYVMLAISAAILNVFVVNVSVANTSNLLVFQEETPEAEILLDKAIEAEAAGNQEALLSSLTAGTAALEKEANADKGSFKDKLLGQVGALQKFAPMVKSGLLKGDMLKKVINTVKMLLAAKRIENALGGSNLLGNVGGLTKNLGLMKAGLPALGGDSQSKLGGLLDTAMGSVGNLSKGGMTAKAAEPAVKKQLGGILDFVKGAI